MTSSLKSTPIVLIGPDVNAPTEINFTGLTVPVEFTTVSTRPFDTLAARYLRCVPLGSQDTPGTLSVTTMPTTTAAITSQRSQERITVPIKKFGEDHIV